MERKGSELEKQSSVTHYIWKMREKKKVQLMVGLSYQTQGPRAPSPLPMLIAKIVNRHSPSPETWLGLRILLNTMYRAAITACLELTASENLFVISDISFMVWVTLWCSDELKQKYRKRRRLRQGRFKLIPCGISIYNYYSGLRSCLLSKLHHPLSPLFQHLCEDRKGLKNINSIYWLV